MSIITEILTAAAGSIVTFLLNHFWGSLTFFRRYHQKYSGTYHGHFYNLQGGFVHEIWEISRGGKVEISQDIGRKFQGKVLLRNNKVYVTVDRVRGPERLFLTFNEPIADTVDRMKCIWLGEDDERKIIAGVGIISRGQIDESSLRNELQNKILELS